MRILADENIPLLDEFFGAMGDIRRMPGRRIRHADLREADVLLVRSVTRVDRELLAGSPVRFVGSATIGTDHVDQSALAEAGIRFASAPGCNARAVAEYVATLLVRYAAESRTELTGMSLGVVGFGNVGKAVVTMAQALGMRVRVVDPLLPANAFPASVEVTTFDELFDTCAAVTLHVPLTHDGPAPTHHLLDAARLAGGAWRLLINTARGPVIDNDALLSMLLARPDRQVALDVWEQEPLVPAALLRRAWHASPHVAGYSSEGKWRGTEQVYRAACKALGMAPVVTLEQVLAARGDAPEDVRWPSSLAGLLSACCPVQGDDRRLRAAASESGDVMPAAFDRLRREYPVRREFSHWRVTGFNEVPDNVSDKQTGASDAQKETPQMTAAFLKQLGFC